ncbi:tyrosine-type recombinase/integrase [uncultured Christiangramia sp.]|uniref:tyrosine-type recombinase/integrase n=1 Tax=uncultured Christiangramia sp. TaxID=503836 RepID=UPI0026183277|nr:tyrosine-type recombinase/integrase [uncultured Christiangramia sp.]
MKPWKGLAIYPKIIETKTLKEFSLQEKKDLTRKGFRWYVYFRYLNPETNKFQKIIAPTLNINRNFPKFEDRYREMRELRDSIKRMLEDGKSPFDVQIVDGEVLTMDKALDLSLERKKVKVGSETYKSYEIRVKQLKAYLKKRGVLKSDTHSFSTKIFREFFNQIAKETSVANRNNTLAALGSIFTDMYKNENIPENWLKRLDKEKTANNRFKTYSHQQASKIIEYLEEADPVMALFIKFIGYNFLRPVEVVRLKAGDIDLENKLLSVFVKQGKSKTKRIPDEIVSTLQNYDLTKSDKLLFNKSELVGTWKRDEAGRRNYYSQRYMKIKKELGYGEGYTMYSFRHTYITIGYQNLRKRLSKDDAMDTLMGYTGHESRDGLKKYIHYHDAEIVGEYKGEIE